MPVYRYDPAGSDDLQNVASVTEKDGQLVFTDIMGIPTVVPGAIEKIDLLENIITIREK